MAALRLLAVMSVFLLLAVVGHQLIKRSMVRKTEKQTIRRVSKKIDAQPFRNYLEAIEELLYQDHVPTYKDTEAIQKAVRDLAFVLEKNTGRTIRSKAVRFMYFGENIGTEGSIGYGPVSNEARQRWIEKWQTILDEEFLPVDWLQGMNKQKNSDSHSDAAPGDKSENQTQEPH